MKKTKLCLLIDVLMFLFLALMSGVGLLIKYILLPGSKRWDVYGRDSIIICLLQPGMRKGPG
ncbi:MAG: hypothetical protein K9J25_05470 [Bacteroidales bacterium]|nr:hypothetical protein [Bacteroidales bacterium]